MTRPIPQPDELTTPFWEACARGTLQVQECQECGTIFFPPAELCISCLSPKVRWRPCSGRGTIYSFTVIRRAPLQDIDVPAVLAIVELDEGCAMYSNVIDCDPDSVRIGMHVAVHFQRISEDVALPLFRPI